MRIPNSLHSWTERHPLYGVINEQTTDAGLHPAKIYKEGCVATDKANYGGYCIWSGPKVVYKTINRAVYPPYGEITKIEKWRFGKDTGLVMNLNFDAFSKYRTGFSGPGKSSSWYTEDGKELKPRSSFGQ